MILMRLGDIARRRGNVVARHRTTNFLFRLSFQACLRDGSQHRKRVHDNESTVESESVGRREALFIAQDIMALYTVIL